MILILSNRSDSSSDIVEEWFIKNGEKYYRIDAEDVISEGFSININEGRIITSKFEVKLREINIIWYRKFGNLSSFNFYKELEDITNPKIVNQLMNEHYSIMQTIVSLLRNKKWITHPDSIYLSKLQVISEAQKHGLLVPDSYILDNKEALKKLLQNGERYISKSINEAFFFQQENYSFSMFTKEITPDVIQKLPIFFFPSLIQKRIPKIYEIRVFLLDKEVYSMAIFSQKDNSTNEDFRVYNWDKPIRFVPYNLPKYLEEKILSLCNSLNVNCCSIDLIKANEHDFTFSK